MQVPQNLKFTIQNTEEELYCGGDVIPGQTHQPTSTSGSYSLFTIPIADFGCTSPSLTQVCAHLTGTSIYGCSDFLALMTETSAQIWSGNCSPNSGLDASYQCKADSTGSSDCMI